MSSFKLIARSPQKQVTQLSSSFKVVMVLTSEDGKTASTTVMEFIKLQME